MLKLSSWKKTIQNIFNSSYLKLNDLKFYKKYKKKHLFLSGYDILDQKNNK